MANHESHLLQSRGLRHFIMQYAITLRFGTVVPQSVRAVLGSVFTSKMAVEPHLTAYPHAYIRFPYTERFNFTRKRAHATVVYPEVVYV